jgi:predicted RNA binding protein YcfA (HicA-like mRNA interferase family)
VPRARQGDAGLYENRLPLRAKRSNPFWIVGIAMLNDCRVATPPRKYRKPRNVRIDTRIITYYNNAKRREGMTERDLKKILGSAGWEITHGKAHDQATHPKKPGVKMPIPRHRGDIPKGTADAIPGEAGLK